MSPGGELSYASVLSVVVALIDEHKPEPVEVTEASEFKSDLNFDSIGIMDLVADIEDHFEVTIPLNELSRMQTVGQTATRLLALIQGTD
jgi:acyl carrier protein